MVVRLILELEAIQFSMVVKDEGVCSRLYTPDSGCALL